MRVCIQRETDHEFCITVHEISATTLKNQMPTPFIVNGEKNVFSFSYSCIEYDRKTSYYKAIKHVFNTQCCNFYYY